MTARARTASRDEITEQAADAAIEQACRLLRLPSIRDRFGEVAVAATRQQASYKSFLVELFAIECEDREARRRVRLVRQAGFGHSSANQPRARVTRASIGRAIPTLTAAWLCIARQAASGVIATSPSAT
ncbi:MAG: hypothetical protein ACRDT6_21600 [Micromonosporaceae bacterium]